MAFAANRDLVFRSIEGQVNYVTRIGIDGQNRVRLSDVNAIDVMGTSPDGRWVSFGGNFEGDRFDVRALPIYGGESRVLCHELCRPEWSPDGASLYLRIGIQPPNPILFVPLRPGQAFPEFPAGKTDALTAWRKLPAARMHERPRSSPGLDESTYIVTKTDDRRNLFRVPLSR